MTLTAETLVEDVAEALWQAESLRASNMPRRSTWAEESEDTRSKWRFMARAALAAVAKAAGGRDACHGVGIAAQVAGGRANGEPDNFLRVAALLRALAEVADDR